MSEIAFEKVPYEQFAKDTKELLGIYDDDKIKKAYDNIKLPVRKTKCSAGYDFSMPFEIIINKYNTKTIPTGIRCKMDDNMFLMLVPRSGAGFKHGLKLLNTVGIIDADYYNSDNYGHIMLKIAVDTKNNCVFIPGYAFAQGIFLPYGLTSDDNATDIRNGGFGSTDKT